jgi:hypothetical protein
MPSIRISRGSRHGVKLASNLISRHGLILRVKSSLSLKGAVLIRTYVPLAYPRRAMGRTGSSITLSSAPITQVQADQWLAEDLQRFADGIHRLLPGSHLWGANQQAALISWLASWLCLKSYLGGTRQTASRLLA